MQLPQYWIFPILICENKLPLAGRYLLTIKLIKYLPVFVRIRSVISGPSIGSGFNNSCNYLRHATIFVKVQCLEWRLRHKRLGNWSWTCANNFMLFLETWVLKISIFFSLFEPSGMTSYRVTVPTCRYVRKHPVPKRFQFLYLCPAQKIVSHLCETCY